MLDTNNNNTNNSDMFESIAYFDPNPSTHHHHIPNFSTIETGHHQNPTQLNWTQYNHNNLHHDQILTNHHTDFNNLLPTQINTQPDLLNLFHQLPKCSSSSICFSDPTRMDQNPGQVLFDDPQAPFFKELLNGFNIGGFGSGYGETGMGMGEEGLLYHETSDGVMEFGGGKVGGKDTKHFATEKHRRQQMGGKYEALKKLIPNPTKADRASIVGDGIEYINELKRTVEELKILVERKRCSRGRMKRHKAEDHSTLDVESIYTRSDAGHDQQVYNGNSTSSTMRSSWLQRKSKNIEIDVRIIDDEVTIKLVQQKRINCLLLVSKALDDLQLDLHHVAGGLIGDFYSYLFNTKICEGSSVYASAIANKLIEVVDKQYATIPVSSSY